MRSTSRWMVASGLASGFATVFGNVVHAHSGHELEVVPNSSALHYVLQPEHALVWLFLMVVLAIVFQRMWLANRKKRVSLVTVDRRPYKK